LPRTLRIRWPGAKKSYNIHRAVIHVLVYDTSAFLLHSIILFVVSFRSRIKFWLIILSFWFPSNFKQVITSDFNFECFCN
jgi:hypothetical protein